MNKLKNSHCIEPYMCIQNNMSIWKYCILKSLETNEPLDYANILNMHFAQWSFLCSLTLGP